MQDNSSGNFFNSIVPSLNKTGFSLIVFLSKCQAKSTPRKAYLSSNKMNEFDFCPTMLPIFINLFLIFLNALS